MIAARPSAKTTAQMPANQARAPSTPQGGLITRSWPVPHTPFRNGMKAWILVPLGAKTIASSITNTQNSSAASEPAGCPISPASPTPRPHAKKA